MGNKKFHMPPVGCIFWSLFYSIGGFAALYLNLVKGYHGYNQGKEAFFASVFIFLGGLMFYKGLREKEYRFWHKDWKSLDEEKAEKEKSSQK